MDSTTYKEQEFDHEDFMLDPFNDGEAMTEMSNPNNQQQKPNGEMDDYMANMTEQQHDSQANLHIDNLE